MCDSSIPSDSKWTLQVDFSNAFNSVDCELLFHEVRQRIPGLPAWLECCYTVQPVLYFGGRSLRSCCGVQQGDPLAPLAFAIALHPILEKIALEVPSLSLHCWYLDDGVVCGCKEDLLKVLSIIELYGPSRGLNLNRSKSFLYVLPDADACVNVLPPEIPLSQEGFVLLGAPIGSDSFCQLHAMKRVEKICDIISLLPHLGNSQVEFTLLHSCLSLPKFVFLLRTCLLSVIHDAIEAFDGILRSAVSDIVGAQLSDWAWLKATLPVSLGGIGVWLASYAAAAFISSVSQSSSLIAQLLDQPSPLSLPHLPLVLSSLFSSAGHSDWSSLESIDVPLQQRHLSWVIDSFRFDSLMASSLTPRFKALALSSSLPHADEWLNATPFPSLGLSFHDWEFSVCLKYWLGVQMVVEGSLCCICGVSSDV